jgi:hypothetical protein
MRTLKEEIELEKKYVAVQYDTATQVKLRQWCIENGYDLTVDIDGSEQRMEDFDFHTTVFFTTNRFRASWRGEFKMLHAPYEAFVVGFEYLGEEENVPVLKVESPNLWAIRDYFEDYGLEDAWDEWKPHISISYAGKHGGVLPPEPMTLPIFPLLFDTYHIKKAEEG